MPFGMRPQSRSSAQRRRRGGQGKGLGPAPCANSTRPVILQRAMMTAVSFVRPRHRLVYVARAACASRWAVLPGFRLVGREGAARGRWLRSSYRVCLGLLCAVLLGCPSTQPEATIALHGLHPFVETDHPDYARADLADQSWPRVAVPGTWNPHTALADGQPGVGWYRLHFYGPSVVPSEAQGVWLGLVGTCDEVYFNGVFIGAEVGCRGRLVEGPPLPRAYQLPASLWRPGQDNVLAVRVRSGYQPPHGIFGPHLLIGPWRIQAAILQQASSLLHFRDGAMLVVLLLSSLAASTLWLLSGRRSEYLLPAVSLWLLLLIAGLDSHVLYTLRGRSEASQRLTEALAAMLPGPLWLAVAQLVDERHSLSGRPRLAIFGVALSFFLTALLAPTRLYVGWLRGAYELFVLVASLSSLWLLGQALRQRGLVLLPLFVGAAALGAGALIDSHGLTPTLLPPSFASDLGLLVMVVGTNLSLLWHFGMVRRAHDAMLQRLAQAAEHERRHLARELHDHVAPSLAFVKLELELLASRASDRQEANSPWQHLREALANVIADLRSISHDLRPSATLGLSLHEAMQRYVGRLQAQRPTGPSIGLEVQPVTLGHETTTHVYRIFQESLQNALRHAQASSIQVTLRREDAHVILTVADDGLGIEPQRPAAPGIGLLHIKERATLIQASLTVHSRAGMGTQIVVHIPTLPPPSAASGEPGQPATTAASATPDRLTHASHRS